jgi:drug/metabolite transporter (DMT)-like permease
MMSDTTLRAAAVDAMSGSDWLLLLALAALWSGSFLCVAVALAALPPLTVVLGRVALGGLALLVLLALRGERMPREPRAWGAFLVMGALNNAIPFALIAWAQQRIDSGLAAICNATTPLFTVALAAIIGVQPLSAARLTGLACGLAGVVLLVGPAAIGGLGAAGWGEAAVLVAALSYAAASLHGRRLRHHPPLVAAAGMLCGAALLLAPLALAIDRPWTLPPPGPAALLAVLAVALLSTALAYRLYFRILASAGATNLMLVTLIIPVGALLLGALALGERVGPRGLAGMALIGAGLAAIDGRAPRWLARRAATTARSRAP